MGATDFGGVSIGERVPTTREEYVCAVKCVEVFLNDHGFQFVGVAAQAGQDPRDAVAMLTDAIAQALADQAARAAKRMVNDPNVWICERHQDRLFLHDGCSGPGMLLGEALNRHQEAAALLKEAEWAGRIWTDTPVCPWCGGVHPAEPPPRVGHPEDRGHRADCRYVAAITRESA